MGTNTLNARTTGQTILDSFFNDFNTAMDGDFVGRGASGIPTSGQNLGTVALPWGVLNCASINLNGSALDTSKITSPPNRIISGKTRSTSNQPAFITPNGTAASFLVAGATTNLALSINSVAVTVNTDITKGSLTLAPSSNNTCLVDMPTITDDAKQLGEEGHAAITVDTMGTNISNLIGKFACFKIVHSAVTEYFVAFVESSTKLSHCIRGYFYDSSLLPVNPVALADEDVITLLSTAHVFVTNDAATVDVSYTFPAVGASAPGSPATGDYWYDTKNNVWKRYDGASFVIINRTLIGIALIDTANCVAARSFDFYAAYSPNNSLDIEVGTTATNAQAKRTFQSVNVAGKEFNFGEFLPTWTGANNYALSADSYTTFAASTNYYLYVDDGGKLFVSDIAPYRRPDGYGLYFRHNPWRCVAFTATDGSSNWTYAYSFGSAQEIRNQVVDYTNNGGQALTASTTNITWSTKVQDTNAAWSGSVFTAQNEGLHHYFGSVRFTAGVTATLYAYKNAAQYRRAVPGGVSQQTYPFSGAAYLLKGDTLSFRIDNSGTLEDSALNHCLSISLVK